MDVYDTCTSVPPTIKAYGDDMRSEAGSVESGHSPDGIDNGPAKRHRQEVLWEAAVGPVGNK
jgi:hypothetical protein